ncbi:helix-turn-helix domain-containing protein [Dactylosporangium salmoneum]|uniref:TetR/AcrR family transcriptional regulator n=1 Tax=Dactylosporangium salmoneum TaxID=53361 RepID=A0ABP5SNQ6_9ACTN
MAEARAARDVTRAHVVEVAARLLREEGPAAVTTRAVAQAAGLQTPVIYRLFEDKDALLDAVAAHVFSAYVTGKARADDSGDPVEDLRAAWDLHIDFGLANGPLFALIADPARASRLPATAAGAEVLRSRVHRVAAAGRLRVPVPRAVDLIRAAGTGAVLILVSMPPADRDRTLADTMFDAVLREILTDAAPLPADDTTAAVIAFQTVVPRLETLSEAERRLMSEWLSRAGAAR